jgi:hypothetical protein
MVVEKVFPSGTVLHGPPYTEAEQDDFYKRVGRGPVTVARPAGDKTTNKNAKSAAIKRDLDPLLRAALGPIGPPPCLCVAIPAPIFAHACRDARAAFHFPKFQNPKIEPWSVGRRSGIVPLDSRKNQRRMVVMSVSISGLPFVASTAREAVSLKASEMGITDTVAEPRRLSSFGASSNRGADA